MDEKKVTDDRKSTMPTMFDWLLLFMFIICALGFALWIYGIFRVGLNPTG